LTTNNPTLWVKIKNVLTLQCFMKTIQYLLMLILALSAFTCVNKTDKAGNDLQNRELESPDSGMAEIYFDSEQDLGAFLESGLYESSGMQKDEENFADLKVDLVLVTAEEYVVAERPQK